MTSHDWCCLATPVPGPVKTVTSYSEAGELHNAWTTAVTFLAREQILSSHHHVVENSGAQDSVQWCPGFLTQGYSSQSKIVITYIHIVLRSRIAGVYLHVSYAYRQIKIKLLLMLNTLCTAAAKKLSEI
jgi:hypothetical protein